MGFHSERIIGHRKRSGMMVKVLPYESQSGFHQFLLYYCIRCRRNDFAVTERNSAMGSIIFPGMGSLPQPRAEIESNGTIVLVHEYLV